MTDVVVISYGPSTPTIIAHNALRAMCISGGNPVEPELPKVEPLNLRRRVGGRNAGDGEYVNRWVFPSEGEIAGYLPAGPYKNRELIFSFDEPWDDDKSMPYYWYQYWYDGLTLVESWTRFNGYYSAYTRVWYTGPSRRRTSSYHELPVKYAEFYKYLNPSNREEIEKERDRQVAMCKAGSYANPAIGDYRNGSFVSTAYIAGSADDLISKAVPPKFSSRFDDFEDKMKYLPHTHVGTLEAEAYVRAVDALPHLGMNNIANIAELCGLISKMLFSGGLTSVGSAQDAWLAYRYAYKTTQSDVNELCGMLNRLSDLSLCHKITSRGTVRDGDVTVRCSLKLDSAELTKIHDFADKWGLKLSSYNAWDMVPYSFVVDWFLDVGGALEHGEAIKTAFKYRSAAWFSYECEFTNEYGCRELYYHRYYSTPNLSEAYLYRVVNAPSGVTVAKRAVDALALVR